MTVELIIGEAKIKFSNQEDLVRSLRSIARDVESGETEGDAYGWSWIIR